MKKIFTVTALLSVLICCAAIPASWQSDPHRARSLSRSRNLPILIVFAGKMDKNTAALKDKLEKLNFVISGHAIPLFVELPPAGSWSRAFKNELQITYPFLTLDSGIPLPALYVTDSDFKDLNIAEPRYTAADFQKMLADAKNKFAAAKSVEPEVPPAAPEVPDAPDPRKLREKKIVKTPEKTVARTPLKQYTTAMQAAEADRQRRANSDPAGDPPKGWFTDPAKAREFAAARKLPIMILFSGTDWCGPCKSLRSKVLDKNDVSRLVVEKCVALYVHVPRGGWGEVRRKYPFWKGGGVPGFLFTDAEFNVIQGVNIHWKDRSSRGINKAIKAAAKSLK